MSRPLPKHKAQGSGNRRHSEDRAKPFHLQFEGQSGGETVVDLFAKCGSVREKLQLKKLPSNVESSTKAQLLRTLLQNVNAFDTGFLDFRDYQELGRAAGEPFHQTVIKILAKIRAFESTRMRLLHSLFKPNVDKFKQYKSVKERLGRYYLLRVYLSDFLEKDILVHSTAEQERPADLQASTARLRLRKLDAELDRLINPLPCRICAKSLPPWLFLPHSNNCSRVGTNTKDLSKINDKILSLCERINAEASKINYDQLIRDKKRIFEVRAGEKHQAVGKVPAVGKGASPVIRGINRAQFPISKSFCHRTGQQPTKSSFCTNRMDSLSNNERGNSNNKEKGENENEGTRNKTEVETTNCEDLSKDKPSGSPFNFGGTPIAMINRFAQLPKAESADSPKKPTKMILKKSTEDLSAGVEKRFNEDSKESPENSCIGDMFCDNDDDVPKDKDNKFPAISKTDYRPNISPDTKFRMFSRSDLTPVDKIPKFNPNTQFDGNNRFKSRDPVQPENVATSMDKCSPQSNPSSGFCPPLQNKCVSIQEGNRFVSPIKANSKIGPVSTLISDFKVLGSDSNKKETNSEVAKDVSITLENDSKNSGDKKLNRTNPFKMFQLSNQSIGNFFPKSKNSMGSKEDKTRKITEEIETNMLQKDSNESLSEKEDSYSNKCSNVEKKNVLQAKVKSVFSLDDEQESDSEKQSAAQSNDRKASGSKHRLSNSGFKISIFKPNVESGSDEEDESETDPFPETPLINDQDCELGEQRITFGEKKLSVRNSDVNQIEFARSGFRSFRAGRNSEIQNNLRMTHENGKEITTTNLKNNQENIIEEDEAENKSPVGNNKVNSDFTNDSMAEIGIGSNTLRPSSFCLAHRQATLTQNKLPSEKDQNFSSSSSDFSQHLNIKEQKTKKDSFSQKSVISIASTENVLKNKSSTTPTAKIDNSEVNEFNTSIRVENNMSPPTKSEANTSLIHLNLKPPQVVGESVLIRPATKAAVWKAIHASSKTDYKKIVQEDTNFDDFHFFTFNKEVQRYKESLFSRPFQENVFADHELLTIITEFLGKVKNESYRAVAGILEMTLKERVQVIKNGRKLGMLLKEIDMQMEGKPQGRGKYSRSFGNISLLEQSVVSTSRPTSPKAKNRPSNTSKGNSRGRRFEFSAFQAKSEYKSNANQKATNNNLDKLKFNGIQGFAQYGGSNQLPTRNQSRLIKTISLAEPKVSSPFSSPMNTNLPLILQNNVSNRIDEVSETFSPSPQQTLRQDSSQSFEAFEIKLENMRTDAEECFGDRFFNDEDSRTDNQRPSEKDEETSPYRFLKNKAPNDDDSPMRSIVVSNDEEKKFGEQFSKFGNRKDTIEANNEDEEECFADKLLKIADKVGSKNILIRNNTDRSEECFADRFFGDKNDSNKKEKDDDAASEEECFADRFFDNKDKSKSGEKSEECFADRFFKGNNGKSDCEEDKKSEEEDGGCFGDQFFGKDDDNEDEKNVPKFDSIKKLMVDNEKTPVKNKYKNEKDRKMDTSINNKDSSHCASPGPDEIEEFANRRHSDSEFVIQKARQENYAQLTRSIGLEDFVFLRELGSGAYGKVYLVSRKSSNDTFAMKIIKFKGKVSQNTLESLLNEIKVLKIIEGQFLTKAFFSFVQKHCLIIVMEYLTGGDFRNLLENEGRLDIEAAKYYMAQLTVALEELHKKSVIHRDLKPENLLLDKFGRLKLADFGLSKVRENQELDQSEEESKLASQNDIKPKDGPRPIVGTPDYIPPEMLFGLEFCQKDSKENEPSQTDSQAPQNESTQICVSSTLDTTNVDSNNKQISHQPSKEVLKENRLDEAGDWWSTGCLLYEFLVGVSPFCGNSYSQVFTNIKKRDITWPEIGYEEDCIPPEAKDLIEKLLTPDPFKRLTASEIKQHPFLVGIDWEKLAESKPPIELDLKDTHKRNQLIKISTVIGAERDKQAKETFVKTDDFTINRVDLLHDMNVKHFRDVKDKYEKLMEEREELFKLCNYAVETEQNFDEVSVLN